MAESNLPIYGMSYLTWRSQVQSRSKLDLDSNACGLRFV